MKDPKFARSRLTGGSYGVQPSRGLTNKGPCKITGAVLFALLMLVVTLGPGYFSDLPAPSSNGDVADLRTFERTASSRPSRTASAILSQRNTSFRFQPRVPDWDRQRSAWLESNVDMRTKIQRIPVLLVTGSQPEPCDRPIDTHMYLKSAKNKVHYSRLHGMHMHYNMMEPHADLTGSWANLAVLRMLMLAHPEVEWFWWADSDTVFLDMELELPLQKYDGYNLVAYGDEHRVYELKEWNGLVTSSFLIRNCEWSLGILDAWASMGPAWSRERVGQFLSEALHGRPDDRLADEQSSLVYLLSSERKSWAAKVFLEKEIFFAGSWVAVTGKLEEMQRYASGDPRLPLMTYFTGCSQCGDKRGEWPWEQCETEMKRAMDFADNIVYETYGFTLRELGTPELVPIPLHSLKNVIETPEPIPQKEHFPGYPIYKLPGPIVRNWDEQRLEWYKSHPWVNRSQELRRPKAMIVTGSSHVECSHPVGAQLLLQALKNKADYARFHDLEFFYGMWDFDSELTYWWTKIPTIRLLMLTRPDVEWFWWCDADAIVTDMVFEFPFEKYEDKNIVLYGDYDLVKRRDWIAINAGVYVIRNCQWSLDFFDVWASLGVKSVRERSGKMVCNLLVGREEMDTDDQSALIALLVTDEEKKWAPKIALERNFTISGYWKIITSRYEEMMEKSQPGRGSMDWPWITHFAGCQPCGTNSGNFDIVECRSEMQRAFDFADNQVLELYGFQHSRLGSTELTKFTPKNSV